MPDTTISTAPWTAEQVAELIRWQSAGYVHEFTCSSQTHQHSVALTPSVDGWICETCGYTQDWAYTYMVDGSLPPSPFAFLGINQLEYGNTTLTKEPAPVTKLNQWGQWHPQAAIPDGFRSGSSYQVVGGQVGRDGVARYQLVDDEGEVRWVPTSDFTVYHTVDDERTKLLDDLKTIADFGVPRPQAEVLDRAIARLTALEGFKATIEGAHLGYRQALERREHGDVAANKMTFEVAQALRDFA